AKRGGEPESHFGAQFGGLGARPLPDRAESIRVHSCRTARRPRRSGAVLVHEGLRGAGTTPCTPNQGRGQPRHVQGGHRRGKGEGTSAPISELSLLRRSRFIIGMTDTIPLISAPPAVESSRLQQISVVAETLVTRPFAKAASALPVLDDMVLPKEYLQRLAPGLEALGFSYEEQTLAPRVGDGGTTYRFTIIKKDGHSKVLLYFEAEVFAEFRREYKLALEEVRDLFQSKYEMFYVFHARLAPIYKNLMLGEWREKYRIIVKFIPLVDVDGFA